MATITKLFFNLELLDGTVLGPVRILAADKIAAESSARKQRWHWDDNPRIHTLMGFYAARRTGLTNAANYDEFMEQLADFSISNDDGQDDDEDPTEDGSGS